MIGLRRELTRLCRLPALAGIKPPTLVVREHEWPYPYSGEAFRWKDGNPSVLVLHLWPGRSAESIRVTLLHELVHLCRPECWEHRAEFKRTYLQAAREAWDVDVREDVGVQDRTVALDDALRAALEARRGWRKWIVGCAREAWRGFTTG